MAARKRRAQTTPEPVNGRLPKRKPRPGPFASKHLSLTLSHRRLLDGYAGLHDTTPSEIVMDWIDQHTAGMRFSIPGGPSARPEDDRRATASEGEAA
jgi:hypothetical protein